jgi:hypothetical protein
VGLRGHDILNGYGEPIGINQVTEWGVLMSRSC